MAVGGNAARGLARRSENVETQALGLVGEAATAARNDHKERPEGPVAQLVEQRAYTASVVGSSPAGSTGGRCRRRRRRDVEDRNAAPSRRAQGLEAHSQDNFPLSVCR